MLGVGLARLLVLAVLAATTVLARDFYQILGVDRQSSDKELKRACTHPLSFANASLVLTVDDAAQIEYAQVPPRVL